jgi:hypothetical protein
MRARLGAVLIALTCGAVANVDAQPRPRPAPPPPPPPAASPRPSAPSGGPANRRPPPPANNPYRTPNNGNTPQPYGGNNNSPPPYQPNNGGYNGNSPAYDPYTDPRQPPPTPPPTQTPYRGSNGSSPQPYPGNGNSPPPYSNNNSPPPYTPNNGGYNGNSPPPSTYVPPPSPTPPPYTNNGNSPPPANGNSSSPTPYTGGNSSTSSPPAPPVSGTGFDSCLGDAGMGGSTYGTQRQRIDVVWPAVPDAYVKLIDVTNGCGPGTPTTDARYGDDSDFEDSNSPDMVNMSKQYYVNFRSACLMHDAGYSGVKTNNIFTGAVVDYFDRNQKQVDDQFLADMLRMCDEQIPATAKAAIANCKGYGGYHFTHGAMTRYKMVQSAGSLIAWKGRPALSGAWASTDGGSWSITVNKRSVSATWTMANPNFRGEFKGTLVSRDADTLIDGHYVIYEKGAARCQPMVSKWTWVPGKPNEIIVTGPNGVQYLKR